MGSGQTGSSPDLKARTSWFRKQVKPLPLPRNACILPHIGHSEVTSYLRFLALKTILPVVRGRHCGGQRRGWLRLHFSMPTSSTKAGSFFGCVEAARAIHDTARDVVLTCAWKFRHGRERRDSSMTDLRRSIAFACAALLVGGAAASEAQAGQGFGGLFLSLPFLGPFIQPQPWHERHYSVPRKKDLTVQQRHLTRLQKNSETALAVPSAAQPLITCERAQAIIVDYGFKDIKAELCTGKNLGFSAMRDGKPFSIEIVAANGELAKVQRVH
jgi:hypothetical protein